MSNDPQDSKPSSYAKINSMLGSAFLVLIPASLVVMLGIVGIAFMAGSADAQAEKAPETAAAPAPAPAPAPAAAPEEETVASVDADVETEAGEIDPAVMALGRTSYALCAACHGPDGQGLKAGPLLMAPSLTGSELNIGDPDAAILIILKGIAKENMDYMGMMAPLGAGLDDEKIAAVLTYTRNSFGNQAPPVTPEQVAEVRARFADLNPPAGLKRGEIEEIVKASREE